MSNRSRKQHGNNEGDSMMSALVAWGVRQRLILLAMATAWQRGLHNSVQGSCANTIRHDVAGVNLANSRNSCPRWRSTMACGPSLKVCRFAAKEADHCHAAIAPSVPINCGAAATVD